MENENDDIFYLLFEKKEEEDKFLMKDEKLLKYRKKVSECSEKLYDYINRRVHPGCREELRRIIENRNNAMSDSYYREYQIYYKYGIIDGMNIILSTIFN